MTTDPSRAAWRKSSFSTAQGNCVEVAPIEESIAVRDTKDKGRGPILAFNKSQWSDFLAAIGNDEFNA